MVRGAHDDPSGDDHHHPAGRPAGEVITQAWGAAAGGSAVSVRNESWNVPSAPATTTSFGLIANRAGAAATPVPTCTAA